MKSLSLSTTTARVPDEGFGRSSEPSAFKRSQARGDDWGALHLNILDLYEGGAQGLFPRGFPYSARIDYDDAVLGSPITQRNVVFSLGLWTGIYDINAVDKVTGAPWIAFP